MYLCVKVVSFFREKFVKKSMCSNFILLSALVFFQTTHYLCDDIGVRLVSS